LEESRGKSIIGGSSSGESSQAGHEIVGIYADKHDALLKTAEIRRRIERGERKSLIIGVEEYPVE